MHRDAIDALAQALVASAAEEWLALPGVGWLTVKEYKAYEGRNPRTGEKVMVGAKRMLFFTVDRALYAALDPAPSGAPPSAPHEDEDEDEGEDDVRERRTPGAEGLAEMIRTRLCAGERADLPGLGAFDLLDKPARPGFDPETGSPIIVPARRVVRFTVADELTARLNAPR
jgi:nucleoid DNA-binding protein